METFGPIPRESRERHCKNQLTGSEQEGLVIHGCACHLHPEAMASPISCRVGTHLTGTATQPLPVSLDDKLWHPWSTHLSPQAFCQNISKQLWVKGVRDLCILGCFLLLSTAQHRTTRELLSLATYSLLKEQTVGPRTLSSELVLVLFYFYML